MFKLLTHAITDESLREKVKLKVKKQVRKKVKLKVKKKVKISWRKKKGLIVLLSVSLMIKKM